MTKSAILLSGGMDSFALTFWERPELTVTLNYGQRAAEAEIRASSLLAERLAIRHEVIEIDLSLFGSGDMSSNPTIAAAPTTDWWPYRNQALITLAAMRVFGEGFDELMIASVRSDSTHVDGTPEFVDLIDNLMTIQEGQLRVRAPAILLSTSELIRESKIPYSLLAWSHSCHTGNIACGNCRGCVKQREVILDLEIAKN